MTYKIVKIVARLSSDNNELWLASVLPSRCNYHPNFQKLLLIAAKHIAADSFQFILSRATESRIHSRSFHHEKVSTCDPVQIGI